MDHYAHEPGERLDLQRPLLQVDAAAARGVADDHLRRRRQLGTALQTGRVRVTYNAKLSSQRKVWQLEVRDVRPCRMESCRALLSNLTSRDLTQNIVDAHVKKDDQAFSGIHVAMAVFRVHG